MTGPGIGLNLHSHLEGSVRPSSAAALARELDVPAPPGGWQAALVMPEAGTLTTFLTHVAHGYPLFGTPDSVRRIVTEAIEDAADDGTRYLELRFGPATHAGKGMTLDDVVGAACDGVRDATSGPGIDAGLVVCALRHHDLATNLAVAETAARFAGQGVVGFDVAGDELLFPELDRYREPYAIARAAGLGLTAHAAEAGPATAARDAAEWLGATRIGHGSHIVDDPEVLAWAAGEGIAIEVCPTSNVLTGAAPSLREHPMHAMLAAGCRVVLGDDNPINIGTRLAAEERRLVTDGGLAPDELARIHRTAVEVAFTDASTRTQLRQRFSAPAP